MAPREVRVWRANNPLKTIPCFQESGFYNEAIIGDMFGRKNIGLLMTLISGIAGGLGGLVSPMLAGWTYDLTGNYQAALQIAILFCSLALIFSVLIITPRKA